MFNLNFKKHLYIGAGFIVIGAVFMPQFGVAEEATTKANDDPLVAQDETTLIYDQTFFAQYPNAVTVLDIIQRIPTGNRILTSGRTGQRGFAANEDRILVNGRRITGKQNDSNDALSRISLDQVERIEIIRGESPDIRVSSGEAILNVVLKEETKSSSVSWKLAAEAVEGVDAVFGGNLSYSGKSGRLSYVLSFDRFTQARTFRLSERFFTGMDSFDWQLDELEKIRFTRHTLSASVTYNFDNGDVIRVNGSFQDAVYKDWTAGEVFEPTGQANLMFVGDASRHYRATHPIWEFSGDYEFTLGDDWRVKLLGLYTSKDSRLSLGEDFLIENDQQADDFLFNLHQFSTELIGRVSVTWELNKQHEIEFGTEVAINTLDSETSFFQRENDALVAVSLPGSTLFIREVRDESFLNYTYRPSSAFSIDISLVAEYSKISLTGDGGDPTRSFIFLKPSVDVRYNLGPRDQLQGQIKRRVDQLQFSDFASSVTLDDQAFGGNTELVQMYRWIFEASYEHRFKNDGGRFMVKFRHHRVQNFVALIPVDDGDGGLLSAVGNVGNGYLWQYIIEGSVRMAFIGLPDVVVETQLNIRDTHIDDAFTGEDHSFNYWPFYQFKLEARHDVKKWGVSYGGRFTMSDGEEFHDIRERFDFNPEFFIAIFAEYQILDGVKLRVELNDLTNFDRGSQRLGYGDGIAGGILTSRRALELREGRIFNVAISGSF